MLFDPDRHEPLFEAEWDASHASEAVSVLVTDMQDSLRWDAGWPVHPLDRGDEPCSGLKTLYFGAAGALWAMWYLQRQKAVKLRIEPRELIVRTYQSYLAEPDTGQVLPSYFLGEVGILLVLWRLTGGSEAANRLFASIQENIPNPTNEALWAAPGTMVGAWHMFRWTGEHRWHDLFLENVEQLWRTWLPSKNNNCYLWTQDLYGRVVQFLGAAHGFAGNVYPLLCGSSLLSHERRLQLHERCVETLSATGVFKENEANWPAHTGAPRPGQEDMLMQWCHGSPGIVTALSGFPQGESPAMEDILIEAGNAVWKAGPLAKGYGLCHGTAGNGYALLALHRRTGDPVWLARARSFAMHAIHQQQEMRRQYGRGRYSLWTGDPGLAVYLWHCLNESCGMPGLDILD
jgi:hypothetical protein